MIICVLSNIYNRVTWTTDRPIFKSCKSDLDSEPIYLCHRTAEAAAEVWVKRSTGMITILMSSHAYYTMIYDRDTHHFYFFKEMCVVCVIMMSSITRSYQVWYGVQQYSSIWTRYSLWYYKSTHHTAAVSTAVRVTGIWTGNAVELKRKFLIFSAAGFYQCSSSSPTLYTAFLAYVYNIYLPPPLLILVLRETKVSSLVF